MNMKDVLKIEPYCDAQLFQLRVTKCSLEATVVRSV